MKVIQYKRFFALFTFAFLSAVGCEVSGQSLDPIELDRPDQTETPSIVPKGYIQIESGLSYEKVDNDVSSIAHPSVLWKYGVIKQLELRLITEFISDKAGDITSSGLSPITIGFKANLIKENGIIPETSILGHLTIPELASKDKKAELYAPAFRFTMQHTLSERLSLGYNLGAEWDGETTDPIFIYTLTTGFSVSDRVGSFVEVYGFSPKNEKTDHRFDTGVTYLINDNAMADISVGVGISDNAPKSFVSMGFSFRFGTK